MKLTVEIASVPDRESVVAEIWSGEEMVAEVSNVGSKRYRIEIYPRPGGAVWDLDFDDLCESLESARNRLVAT